MSRRRGATAIASNPVLVGVATTLVIVVAVFLAYNANAGPALGTDLPAHGRGAGCDQRGEGQRGPDRRVAGGRRGQDHPGPARRRVRDGGAGPEARDPDQATAGGLHDHGSPTVGAGAEVHRDHARRVSAWLPGGRHDPDREPDRYAGRVR